MLANDRCNQQNLIAQLQQVGATRMPVDQAAEEPELPTWLPRGGDDRKAWQRLVETRTDPRP